MYHTAPALFSAAHCNWNISHDLLTHLLRFEFLKYNVLQAVGALWRHDTSIPMGRPFSAQSAALHTLWKIKRAGKPLRDWGVLEVSEEGYIHWCQFRDSILLAMNLPPAADTSLVQIVCDTLSAVWDLELLCDCSDAGKPACNGECVTQTRRALGTCMTVGAGVRLSSTHPTALKPDWSLRYGKPIIIPTRAAREHLPCVHVHQPHSDPAMATHMVGTLWHGHR